MANDTKLIKAARKQRAAQIKRENAETEYLLKSWRKIARDLRHQLKIVMQRLAESIEQTGSPSATLIYEKAHIQILLDETIEQLNKYSDHVKTVTQKQVVENAISGAANAQVLSQIAVSEATAATVATQWAAVNSSHIETLVAKLKPGGAFNDVLEKIAPEAKQKLADAILTRVGMGEQPESVSKDFDSVLGGAAGRFITIARTANMDAYRTSQTEFFKANNDIISGWQWHSSLSFDTCPACLAMHGKYFRDDEEMESHWSCRCVPLPVVKGFATEPMQSGEDWLKSQPEDIQRKVLGPKRYELWREGRISLQDMVTHSHDKTKGWMYHQATIDQSLRNAIRSDGGTSQIEFDPRISDFVKNHVQGDLGKQIDDTFEVVESVHTPIVPRNEYDIIRASKIKDNAYFDKNKKEIGIRPNGENVELSITHELGHQFHLEGFTGTKNASGYTTLDSDELRDLGDALKGSKAITQMQDVLDSGLYLKKNGISQFEVSLTAGMSESEAFEEYRKVHTYLKDHEQFSRAYAQYVALRSDNKTMLAQVDTIRKYDDYARFSQWDDDDFTPIAAAFDKILRRKGLRK